MRTLDQIQCAWHKYQDTTTNKCPNCPNLEGFDAGAKSKIKLVGETLQAGKVKADESFAMIDISGNSICIADLDTDPGFKDKALASAVNTVCEKYQGSFVFRFTDKWVDAVLEAPDNANFGLKL